MPMQIEPAVINVLEASLIEGNQLTLMGQLDRKLYTKVDAVLKEAGGKWNRKAKAHIFSEDPTDVLDRIILVGAITTQKDFGFFQTSVDLSREVVDRAMIGPHDMVLEPSAGQGRIAIEAAALALVDVIELQEANIDVLNAIGVFASVTQADFLTVPPERKYDVVVMNPPFAKQADIRHVMHAYKFLKPGGRLVAITSASVLFRENALTKEFRELVMSCNGTMEALPEGSFKESGTNVNTALVTMFA